MTTTSSPAPAFIADTLAGGAGASCRILSTTRDSAASKAPHLREAGSILRHMLELPPEAPVVFARQVHGTRIGDGDAEQGEDLGGGVKALPSCDALLTRRPGVILVVRTADCAPVVVASRRHCWLGAAHSGWRGTMGAIVPQLIDRAASEGIDGSDMEVWIGPRIGGEVYEVSGELADQFARRWGHLGQFVRGRLLDLGALIALQAESKGVARTQVRVSEWCTFRRADLFPSYRRDGECRGQILTAAVLDKATH